MAAVIYDIFAVWKLNATLSCSAALFIIIVIVQTLFHSDPTQSITPPRGHRELRKTDLVNTTPRFYYYFWKTSEKL